MNTVTPIVTLGKIEENIVDVKRDDLLPFSFGGNKVRIAQEYFLDMEEKGCDCLVGYGNARSNLCRVLANMSSSKGIPCRIISPDDTDGGRCDTANSFLVDICGAEVITCPKTCVAQTVESVLKQCRAEGYNPYYIYGDKTGNGNEATPVRAYAKVYSQIKQQTKEAGVYYDMIFLATGTGMTQAGLLAGAAASMEKQTIIGISVARSAEQETQVLEKFISAYLAEKGISDMVKNPVIVTDDYLCGRYGKYDERISETIRSVYLNYGMQLDPTYSGKGFAGMLQWLKDNSMKNKRVLFLHTGGTPLFFDFLKNL